MNNGPSDQEIDDMEIEAQIEESEQERREREAGSCNHNWVNLGGRRQCSHCRVGEPIPARPGGRVQVANVRQVIQPLDSIVDPSAADRLMDVAGYVSNLESKYQELRRDVIDALGERGCICEHGRGNPMAPDHSLQCKVLRAAAGIDDRTQEQRHNDAIYSMSPVLES